MWNILELQSLDDLVDFLELSILTIAFFSLNILFDEG